MAADFRRELPPSPDFEQQKKLAKELLRAFEEGGNDAQLRVRTQLPDKPTITLADAQFVLAREYGFENWAELKHHIEEKPEPDALGAIRKALEQRDARAVRRLLQRHAELRAAINEPVFSFNSPAVVHFAGDEDPALIEVLLEFGANPNRRSDWWAGPFHALHAASPAAARVLIAAGAEVDACAAAHLDQVDLLEQIIARDPARVHERGGDGQTPLHFARSRAVVDLLLGAGADIDVRDVDHRATPAEWMLDHRRGRGRYELAQYLVERGASTDIFLAAALGLNQRVRALLEENPELLELRSTQGEYGEKPPSSFHIYMWTIGANLSPIQVATQFDHKDTAEVMRSFATPRQRLLVALADGNAAEVQALLSQSPDLLQQLTPEDQRVLPVAAWAPKPAAVKLMLELGFDPFTTDANGATALHCAAFEGSAEIVRALLRHPAAAQLVQLRDPVHQGTPLGWCTYGSCYGPKHREHVEIARLLLAAGAKPDDPLVNASAEVRAVIDAWRARTAAT